MVNIARSETRRAPLDQETTHTLVGARPDYGDIRYASIGDPHLRPIEDIGIPIAARICSHAGGIAAGIGFGQSEAADSLATRHARKPVLLLLISSIGMDRKHDQRSLHGDKRTQATIASLQFLTGQAITDRAQPCTAVALKVHPQ